MACSFIAHNAPLHTICLIDVIVREFLSCTIWRVTEWIIVQSLEKVGIAVSSSVERAGTAWASFTPRKKDLTGSSSCIKMWTSISDLVPHTQK